LIALLAVWLIVTIGWELAPVTLAPGDTYRFAPRNLELTYQIEQGAQQTMPMLTVRMGTAEGRQLVAAPTTLSLAGVDIRIAPGPPALLITTADGATALARAGQSDTAAELGLTFPSPGSEESIVLPTQAVGLRIVRMADDATAAARAAFMLEIYQGESPQPVKRVTIGGNQVETIPIREEDLALQVTVLPGLAVSARSLPGIWLLWLAGGLVGIGAAGFWFRPAFALAQIAPWPEERAVLVLQSDTRAEIATMEEWLNREQGATVA
jgi:hypothetical protein